MKQWIKEQLLPFRYNQNKLLYMELEPILLRMEVAGFNHLNILLLSSIAMLKQETYKI